MRQRYRKKADQLVIAVQLELEQAKLTYRKWGDLQTARRGDWLVDNEGDIYTVEQASFHDTYERVRPGLYRKTAPIWAERMTQAGAVATKEGLSNYAAGDYLVSNQQDGGDAYCIAADKFTRMYELDP